MKHLVHFMDKYEDVAETLKTFIIAILVTTAILGLAPLLMVLQYISI